tara:strand:- start:10470 stop:11405 length:936 start_codon:yes stop_codon:yes gene_type:complete
MEVFTRKFIARNFYLLNIYIKLRKFFKPTINETGGTSNPNYCYSLFLRTFNSYFKYCNKIPKGILEVGPGDSNVVSLLWLMIGSKKVISIDAYEYLKKDQLIDNFKSSSELLINKSFCKSNINPKLNLNIYEKLWTILPPLKELRKRQKIILNEIHNFNLNKESKMFSYIPNYTLKQKFSLKFDLIFSQAVFEHIKEPKKVLNFIHNNLSNNGIVYTSVDFKSHGSSTLFNGHYLFSESQYKKISSLYLFRFINRLPPSWFEKYLNKKFKLLEQNNINEKSLISYNEIKSKDILEEDLSISSSLFISKKNN